MNKKNKITIMNEREYFNKISRTKSLLCDLSNVPTKINLKNAFKLKNDSLIEVYRRLGLDIFEFEEIVKNRLKLLNLYQDDVRIKSGLMLLDILGHLDAISNYLNEQKRICLLLELPVPQFEFQHELGYLIKSILSSQSEIDVDILLSTISKMKMPQKYRSPTTISLDYPDTSPLYSLATILPLSLSIYPIPPVMINNSMLLTQDEFIKMMGVINSIPNQSFVYYQSICSKNVFEDSLFEICPFLEKETVAFVWRK